MANDQLVHYLRQELIGGKSKESIHVAALAAGWSPADIKDAFAVIDAGDTTASAPVPLITKPLAESSVATTEVSQSGATVLAPDSLVQPRPSHLLWFFLALVGVIAAGGVAFAYFENIGPFSITQYTEATFLSDTLAKAAQIKTATYKVSVSLAVNQRENDATTFVVPVSNTAHEAQYKNDVKRITDLRAIAGVLDRTYGSKSVYSTTKRAYVTSSAKLFPSTLIASDLKNLGYGASSTDPVSKVNYAYTQTEGGKNYALSATLETTEALAAIRKSYYYTATSTLLEGQKVSLTKDSGYLYIPYALPKPFLVQLADMSKVIPPDVSGNISMGATTDLSAKGKGDWHFALTANGDLGDLSYSVDVEALKKDKNYYVRINKMPSFFLGSLSAYKGKWIVIDPTASSTRSSFGMFGLSSTTLSKVETNYQESRDASIEASKKLVQLADKNKLISFKVKPIRDSVDGRSLYKYSLQLNKTALVPFYKEMLADTSITKALSITNDPGLLAYLQSKEFDDVYAYLDKNVFITYWTDKSGFPAQVEYRLRVVPPDTATQLKDKQIDIVIRVVFTDINTSVNIEVPKDVTPIEKVADEMNDNTTTDSDALK